MRPFDWLAHIKLNNGLTLDKWPSCHTRILLLHRGTHLCSEILTTYHDSLYFTQVASRHLTVLNIKSIYHLM